MTYFWWVLNHCDFILLMAQNGNECQCISMQWNNSQLCSSQQPVTVSVCRSCCRELLDDEWFSHAAVKPPVKTNLGFHQEATHIFWFQSSNRIWDKLDNINDLRNTLRGIKIKLIFAQNPFTLFFKLKTRNIDMSFPIIACSPLHCLCSLGVYVASCVHTYVQMCKNTWLCEQKMI